jgi:vesicle coat complex subunit
MSGDAKYFSGQKRGELYELKAELHSDKPQKRKDAVKTVMAGMTSGKDMSALFPDVVQNMSGGDLEMKKLVYLYIMNYARRYECV